MSKLTGKQEMFCREYLVDLNATQAAIRAGYSEKTAAKIGSENLIKPDISERIKDLFDKRSKKVEIDADWVLTQAKNSFEINAVTYETEAGVKEMVNATAAGKFLEMCGKHVNVQAFLDKSKVEHELTDDFESLMGDASSDE